MIVRILLAAAIGVLAFALGAFVAPPAKCAPNFLVVVCDDCGMPEWEAGHPVLDGIKANGVTFTNARTGPLCSITRASLYTGKSAFRYGILAALGNSAAADDPAVGARTVPLSAETLPEILEAAGYWTALVGKYHVGPTGDAHRQGFRFAHIYSHADGSRYLNSHRFVNGVDTGPVTHQATAAASDLVDLLVQVTATNKPFYVTYAPHLIHGPMEPAEPYASAFPNTPEGKRAAMFEHLMASVNAALAVLPAAARAETYVFVLSDNGMSRRPQHGGDMNNAGLRGYKRSLYDGGVKSHLIVSGPTVTARGTIAAPVDVLDVPTTIAALAGVSFSDTIDGRSLVPLLSGSGAVPALAVNLLRGSAYGDYAYSRTEGGENAVWKLVRDNGASPWELYRLDHDPGETADVCATRAARCAAMQTRLATDIERGTRVNGVASTWSIEPGVEHVLPRPDELSVGSGDIEFEMTLTLAADTGVGYVLSKQGQWRVDIDAGMRLRVVVTDSDPIGVPFVWRFAEVVQPGVPYRLRFRHSGLPRGVGRAVAALDAPGLAVERFEEATTDGLQYRLNNAVVGGNGSAVRGTISGLTFWIVAWGEW